MNQDGDASEMEQGKTFKAEVEEVLAKQALALNYEYGMTSRILPIETAEGRNLAQLLLDLTHSGMDFDLKFLVKFTDDSSGGMSWELVAPEQGGGTIWQEVHRSVDDFKKAVAGLPYYVQGFFSGRASRDAVGSGAQTG